MTAPASVRTLWSMTLAPAQPPTFTQPPDWCRCQVTLQGTPEQIDHAALFLHGELPDFDRVLPLPEPLLGATSAERHEWRVTHWGSGLPASGQVRRLTLRHNHTHALQLHFQTLAAPPTAALQALARLTGVHLDLCYLSDRRAGRVWQTPAGELDLRLDAAELEDEAHQELAAEIHARVGRPWSGDSDPETTYA